MLKLCLPGSGMGPGDPGAAVKKRRHRLSTDSRLFGSGVGGSTELGLDRRTDQDGAPLVLSGQGAQALSLHGRNVRRNEKRLLKLGGGGRKSVLVQLVGGGGHDVSQIGLPEVADNVVDLAGQLTPTGVPGALSYDYGWRQKQGGGSV